MYSDNELQDFYKNYRESLSSQYENAKNALEQQRRNAQSGIMAGANKGGMLFSNFTERAKTQYDAETYQPNTVTLYNTYQSGLDSLRNNIAKYQNSIRDIQDAIAHLNSMT